MGILPGYRARVLIVLITGMFFCAALVFMSAPKYLAFAQEDDDDDDLMGDLDPGGLPDDDDDDEDTDVKKEKKERKKEGDIRAQEMTLWEQFKQSGAVGFIILLLEVAVLTLIIEAFINVNVNRVIPTELTLDLEGKLAEEKIDDTVEACYENPGVMTNILRAGLEAPENDLGEAKDNIDMAGDLETDNFLHRINFLSVFATIAPMLGLLGTVVGMVKVFGKVASASALGKPEELAGGINQALLTTEYGLIVGIPAMFMYYYFKIRANKILLAVETVAKNLVKWRSHKKGIPTLGLFPNKILLAIEEALSDSFVGLFPFLGFLLGPLSIAKGLRVKDEVSTAMASVPVENPGRGSDLDDEDEEERVAQKLIITPEVSANLWKASAAIIIGVAGIIISFACLAIFILAMFFDYNLIKIILGEGT